MRPTRLLLPVLTLALPLAAYSGAGHGTEPPVLELVVRRTLAREPGNSTACWGGVRIVRTGDLSKNLVVKLGFSGTALADRDYLISPAQTGSGILLPAGLDSLTVVIRPIDDAEVEGPESVDVELLPGTDYGVGPLSRATVRIDDNDSDASQGNETGLGGM